MAMASLDLNAAELMRQVGDALDYLAVEPFLTGFTQVQALHAAFSTEVIDWLSVTPELGISTRQLAQTSGLDPRGLDLLLTVLRASGMLVSDRPEVGETRWSLSPAFAQALRFRELIECRIDFARLITPDLLGRLSSFLASPDRFMRDSALFELFDYSRCFERSEANLAATQRWVRITTAYTRHEARVLLRLLDLTGHRRMLDIGGNSGEMVQQACEAWPALEATVVDLPLVCEVGRRHVASSSAASRICFLALDALGAPMPPADIVLFKSVLHDWPDEAVSLMLANARKSLAPGGRLVIFERCLDDDGAGVGSAELSYGYAPLLLFVQGFRTPERYAGLLAEAGFVPEQLITFRLDTRFCLIVARR